MLKKEKNRKFKFFGFLSNNFHELNNGILGVSRWFRRRCWRSFLAVIYKVHFMVPHFQILVIIVDNLNWYRHSLFRCGICWGVLASFSLWAISWKVTVIRVASLHWQGRWRQVRLFRSSRIGGYWKIYRNVKIQLNYLNK